MSKLSEFISQISKSKETIEFNVEFSIYGIPKSDFKAFNQSNFHFNVIIYNIEFQFINQSLFPLLFKCSVLKDEFEKGLKVVGYKRMINSIENELTSNLKKYY